MLIRHVSVVVAAVCLGGAALAADKPDAPQPFKIDTTRGDRMIGRYFRAETAKLTNACLADITTLEEWKAKRGAYRQQLFEMLGLDPLPDKTDLKPVITGKLDHEQFTVEKLYFQSRPGLYVTGDLYIPKNLEKPAPTILYVCGHARKKKGDVSLGNKTAYQHHGEWFARNGYVCLTIDTLQLGEIEGVHHGTYDHGMWWWNARGYAPAGVEAWNCIRSLDYLQTRPEVDKERFGVTGRSGGGAYSWWITALDDRIKAAVPVAGITDLQNYVVDAGPGRYHDGCIEGHCDCMFMLNTYRWDFPLVAALAAPRPLLIGNSDKDSIFPLDGVVRLHAKVRRIYRLYGAQDKLGLNITEGPHQDTQELRVHAFSWFNRFLKGERPLIDKTAEPLFEPEQLKVFDTLPTDELNSHIHDTFTAKAPLATPPASKEQWSHERQAWLAALKAKSFGGWPSDGDAGGLNVKPVFSAQRDGIAFSAYDFTSQPTVRLRLYVAQRAGLDKADLVVLNALDDEGWRQWLAGMRVGFADELKDETLPAPDAKTYDESRQMFKNFKWAMAYVGPRGIGPTAWNQDPRKQTQHRRRFVLLGQTLDGMRVWDVRRAAQALRSIGAMRDVQLWMQGQRQMAGVVLYASLFEPNVHRLDLWYLPHSQHDGPILLNVLRYLDTPQAVAMAAEHSQVRVYQHEAGGWDYVQKTADKLDWGPKRFAVRVVDEKGQSAQR